MGADVGYDPDLFDSLLQTLEAQCPGPGSARPRRFGGFRVEGFWGFGVSGV